MVGPQVRLGNVSFNSISDIDNEMLVSSFSEEEVKFVVWSCDSSKSPRMALISVSLSFVGIF